MAAAVFLLASLNPLIADAEATTAVETKPLPSPKSASAAPPEGGWDTEGGSSPPPGKVDAAFRPPEVTTSNIPKPSRLGFRRSTDEFIYETDSGVYAFSKDRPFSMRHRSLDGRSYVVASFFLPDIHGIIPFQDASVLRADRDEFRTRYSFARGGSVLGNVTVLTSFQAHGPPKISAELQSRLPQVAILWVVLTTDAVASSDGSVVDFRSIDSRVALGAPNFRVQIGPDTRVNDWNGHLTLDWRDAGSGNATVGKWSVGPFEGNAVVVKFPDNMRIIDPWMAGASSVNSATDFTLQRKTFTHAGRVWVFWDDGEYVVYASSADGSSWSVPAPVAGRPHGGFDVAYRDGLVALAIVPEPAESLHVIWGRFAGSRVNWHGASMDYPDVWSFQGAGPPSVAIGTDGFIWTAVVRWENGVLTKLYIHRSLGSAFSGDALDFYRVESYPVLTGDYFTNPDLPSQAATRVLAMPNGGAFIIITNTDYVLNGEGFVRTYRCGPGACPPPLGPPQYEIPYEDYPLGMDPVPLPHDILSAVALPDGRVRLAYRYHDGSLWTATIYPWDFVSWDGPLDVRPIEYPTIATDQNGDTHIFYVHQDAVAGYHIFYVRSLPLTDTWVETPEEPFQYGFRARRSLTTAPFATSQLPVVWTEEPSSGGGEVWYSLVPTPLDLGSQTGQPWNRQGISPYQSYYENLGEYVSPGSGLLTVKQTDLAVPGRALSLEVSRVFVTPRAFTSAGPVPIPSPYLYEPYPWADLGFGWRLNFPWISHQYLHLWDGQMYVLAWEGNVVENHDGEHFRLTRAACGEGCFTYELAAKTGIRYLFDSGRKLTTILDPTGSRLDFEYMSVAGLDRIHFIREVLASGDPSMPPREAVFKHAPDGTLSSLRIGDRTVVYTYDTTTVPGLILLVGVYDPLGRSTRYMYENPACPYQLTAVVYPTGGKTRYAWSAPVAIGPDLHAYYVTSQDTLNSVGASIRANVFNPTTLNGRITYMNVQTMEALALRGSTAYLFDGASRRATTIHRDHEGSEITRSVAWFGADGAVEQLDVNPTAGPSAHSSYMSYDDWGNPIYTRDGIGRESFASFANTQRQGGFFAPGSLSRDSGGNGLLFFDDFEERNLEGWSIQGSVTNTDLSQFETLPPALKVSSMSGTSTATHWVNPGPGPYVWMEAVVLLGETTADHTIRLRSIFDDVTVEFRFAANGHILRLRETGWAELGFYDYWSMEFEYESDRWYRVSIGIRINDGSCPNGRYRLFIDGGRFPGLPDAEDCLLSSSLLGEIEFETTCSSCVGSTLWVDSVKAWRSMSITINGVDDDRQVRYSDSYGRLVGTWQGTSGPLVIGFPDETTLFPGGGIGELFPGGTIQVLDKMWGIEYTSPSRFFWGGDSWTYEPPWRDLPLTLTSSGYLKANYVYVEDAVPPSGVSDPELDEDCDPSGDCWHWGTPAASGTQAHFSLYIPDVHSHSFKDSSNLLGVGPGWFLVQYVFLGEGSLPTEIMLQFRDDTDSWDHRAYWGANDISLGIDGTASRRWMGGLPEAYGRWVLLTAKADDVGMVYRNLEGMAYTLHDGWAGWDFSATGDAQTGTVRVGGLMEGTTVTLIRPDGTPLVAATVPSASNTAVLDLYGDESTPVEDRVRWFPFDGYFVVAEPLPAGTTYRSPILSIYGGDQYGYSQPDFYPNLNVDSGTHDRPVGILQFQTGRGADTPLPQKRFMQYTVDALLERSKVWDGVTWQESIIDYDPFTRLSTQVTDPLLRATEFEYTHAYGPAYVSKVTDSLARTFEPTYDPTAGWVLSSRDGLAHTVRYERDSLGRILDFGDFDLTSSASRVLYWDMESTLAGTNPAKMRDLSSWGHLGTVVGTLQTSGAQGMSRAFDGDDRVTSPSFVPGAYPWRVVAGWFRVDESTDYARLVSYGSSSDSNYLLLLLSDSATDHRLYLAIRNSGGAVAQVFSDFSPTEGEWFHVVATVDGLNSKLYVNGLDRTATVSGSPGTTNFAAPFSVGAEPTGQGALRGAADEVYVFRDLPSEEDRHRLHQNKHGLVSRVQVAYDDAYNILTVYEPTTSPRQLHLDMETLLPGGLLLEDWAGHGSHGTLTGTTPTSGRVGGARDFDGVDDAVSLSMPGLNANWGESVTVSFWLWWRGGNSEMPFGFPNYGLEFLNGEFGFTTGQGDFWGIPSAALENRWVHVVAIFHNGDIGRSSLFIDGQPQIPQGSPGVAQVGSTALVSGWPTTPDRKLDGKVDEVQVFNRAVTDGEAAALFEGSEVGFYHREYYDSLGRVTRVLRRSLDGSLMAREEFVYEYHDLVRLHRVFREGSTSFETSYSYDFLGRPTLVSPPSTDPVEITYYDSARTKVVEAENGRRTSYRYDPAGLLTEVREEIDYLIGYYSTLYEYDHAGNLIRVQNALWQETEHEYDTLNRLTKTTYADGGTETYSYDAVGNLRQRVDRAGQVETYSYDAADRLRFVCYGGPDPCTDAAADVVYEYDPNDNPTRVWNDEGETTYVYDSLGRVKTETTQVGVSQYPVDYQYDAAGRVTTLEYPEDSDGERRSITYHYELGRTDEVQGGEGRGASVFSTFAYFADDLLKDVVFGNGVVQARGYHPRGWPTSILATHPSSSGPLLDITYGYDDSGNVASIGGATQVAQNFLYDKLDRMLAADGPYPGGSFEYRYDRMGNRFRGVQAGEERSDPRPVAKSAEYAEVFNEWSVNPSTGGYPWTVAEVNALQAGVELEETNWFVRLTQVRIVVQRDGGVTETLLPTNPGAYDDWQPFGSGAPNYQYVDEDPHDGDDTHLTASTPGAADLYGFTDLQGTGNILSVKVVALARVDPFEGTPMPDDCAAAGACYGWVRLLIGLSSVAYDYNNDPNGMNELTSEVKDGVTTSFQYDANLNLRYRDDGTSRSCYDWNPSGLLEEVRQLSSGGDCATVPGARVEAYSYDGAGRRVRTDGPSPGEWTVLISSGMETLFEAHGGGSTTKYVYAAGLRVARIDCTADDPPASPMTCSTSYYLSDALGSTRKVLDDDPVNPADLFSAEYEPFGAPYNVAGSEAFRYTGELEDGTGLVYLRARQYDPDLGRFVSADPVLGSLSMPQTLNRFPYVANNPLTYTDPTGECPWCLVLLFAGLLFVSIADVVYLYTGDAEAAIGIAGAVPGADVFVDAYFLQKDCSAAWGGEGSWLDCAVDVLFLFIPFFGVGIIRGGSRLLKHADDVPQPRGQHTVYTLVDDGGNVRYVGRTTRTAEVRLLEHQRGWRRDDFEGLRVGQKWPGLNYAQARGLEHTLFIKHGGRKELLNLISPISFLNVNRKAYLRASPVQLPGLV